MLESKYQIFLGLQRTDKFIDESGNAIKKTTPKPEKKVITIKIHE